MTNDPTLSDIDTHNGATAASDLPFAERRYEYLVLKRDQLQDRIRTGALLLNGASLVAMLAFLGDDSKSAAWLGITDHTARVSATSFLLGAVLAGVSMVATSNLFVAEASHAFQRYVAARRLNAAYRAPADERGWTEAKDALLGVSEAPLVDFHYSTFSIATQNASAGAWFVGMAVPLAYAFGWS